MNKTLLVAALLLPLAIAKVPSGTQLIPVPDCFPCDGMSTITAETNLIPVPDCFPCDGMSTITAKSNLIPVPDCFPCDGMLTAQPRAALAAENNRRVTLGLRRDS